MLVDCAMVDEVIDATIGAMVSTVVGAILGAVLSAVLIDCGIIDAMTDATICVTAGDIRFDCSMAGFDGCSECRCHDQCDGGRVCDEQ